MKRKNKKIFTFLVFALLLLVLSGCKSSSQNVKPIQGFSGVLDILVWPMAGLMYGIGKTVAFGYYGIVIVLATIIVRTLAWPIYTKTNDLSLKMNIAAPEIDKIQAKYAGKNDKESQQRMQLELLNVYRKYGIGFGGCLLPFVQFPIFLAFYQTLQRIPLTRNGNYKLDFGFLNGNFLGIDLFKGRFDLVTKEPVGTKQTIGIIVLAVLVGLTQIISQILTQKRQKKAQEESQANIPEYRRKQQTETQKQTEMSMKIMVYTMTVMMVIFVLQSTAALGLYWLVGNLYTMIQGYISHKNSKKRLEKLRAKY